MLLGLHRESRRARLSAVRHGWAGTRPRAVVNLPSFRPSRTFARSDEAQRKELGDAREITIEGEQRASVVDGRGRDLGVNG